MFSRNLALRDMPRASLLGLLAPVLAGVSVGQTDFGAEGYQPQFSGDLAGAGNQFSPQFGGYQPSFGTDAVAPPVDPSSGAALVPNPNNPAHHAVLMQAYHKQMGMQKKTNERLALLSPNDGSSVDVEAYVFSLNPSIFTVGSALAWGTANGWTAFKNPQTSFRAEILKVNVNSPGVAYLQNIQTANVNAQVGAIADAYTFTALANGSRVSLPTLPPQNTLQVNGTWTVITPVPFTAGQSFILALDFMGWATVTPT